jgi:ankyrin repeat protein
MKQLVFRMKHNRATFSDVESFEAKLGARLPEDYREFLAMVNGGEQPRPKTFFTHHGGTTMLSRVFGLVNDPAFSLPAQLNSMREYLPVGMFAIGMDIGGNKVCLSIRQADFGAVFFSDHEVVGDCRQIAGSFAEFVDGLFDKPPEGGPDPLLELAKHGGRVELTRFLDAGNTINVRNQIGYTLVQLAAHYGNVALLLECANLGADFEGAIHMAARGQEKDVIGFLLQIGCDINEPRAGDGKTPLQSLIIRTPDFVTFLREIGGR